VKGGSLGDRLWKLRQRYGIAARKVAVRTEVAWYWRWLAIGVAVAAFAGLATWVYDAGRRFAGFDRSEVQQELARARQELGTLRAELERLRAVANAADSKLSIERTAQASLAQQIRGLEQENARLREELAIFESMLSSDARSMQTLSIQRFKVEPDVLPGEYRYGLMLLSPGAKRDFQGRLEFLVTLTRDGKSAIIHVPEQADAGSASFRLAFKYYQRVEGSFRIDARAKIESVQVRVYDAGSGQARAMQTVTPG